MRSEGKNIGTLVQSKQLGRQELWDGLWQIGLDHTHGKLALPCDIQGRPVLSNPEATFWGNQTLE